MKKKIEIEALLEKIRYGHCPTCKADENVFCKRDCDAKCLDCGKGFCAGHIMQHLKDEHQMTETMDHCTNVKQPKKGVKIAGNLKIDRRRSPEFCTNCNSKKERNESHIPVNKIVKGREVKYCEIRIRRR